MKTNRAPDALLVVPDYGNAPFLWTRYGMRAGGNCCDATARCELHPLSSELWRDMADWAIDFENAPRENGDLSAPVLLDWPSFHERGMVLARRLKAEVGAIRVIYTRPTEDPARARDGAFEVLASGVLRRLPNWLGSPFRLCETILSGGQTGVDRAALDFAIAENYQHGGWCPRGRKAEDGIIDSKYALTETMSARYETRTRCNVRNTDGTLIFNFGELSDGTRETLRIAKHENKPHLVIALDEAWEPQLTSVHTWLQAHVMARLNIAGPRESKRPGIYRLVNRFLKQVLDSSGNAQG